MSLMDRVAPWVAPGTGRLPPLASPSSVSPAAIALRAVMLVAAATLTGVALVFSLALLAGPVLSTTAQAIDVTTAENAALDRLGERSVVRAADGSVLAVLHDEVDRDVVGLEEIPDHVQDAVLTAEDRRFFEHDGYDLSSIGRAVAANVDARRVEQGGSTITQQLAKQNFVGSERTLTRKINELVHALALEGEFSKEELLERYLNQVYFGRGAYGVAAAAEEYFGADHSDLAVEDGALLAALISSPSTYDPQAHPERAKERRDDILTEMVDEGHLSAEEAAAARAEPVAVEEPSERQVSEPHVVEAVKRQFLANPAFGETKDERIATLFSGGLEIRTTLDPRLQRLAGGLLDEQFGDDVGPTGAIAALDPRNGRILALGSGPDFDRSQFDLATQGRRQPGSAFKPFVLATALADGFPEEVSLDGTSPAYFDEIAGWDRAGGGVRNYGGVSRSNVDLREATVGSVNTAYAQLMTVVGIESVVDMVDRLGVNVDAALGGPDEHSPAMALGGLHRGVTPLEMAAAYGVFATAGHRAEPFLIERVTGPSGRKLFAHTPDPASVVEPAVAARVTDILQDVVRRGTGTAARLDRWEPAGKTGTTQDNHDAWFTGYVPLLSTAVWVGHPDEQTPMPGMTGGSVPARLWQAFMAEALAAVEPTDFPDVEATLAALRENAAVKVPDVTGMERSDARTELLKARLLTRTRSVATRAPAGEVVWQDPDPGSKASPGDEVVLGVSSGSSWTRPRGPGGHSSTPPSTAPSPSPTTQPDPPPSGGSPQEPEPGRAEPGHPPDSGEPPTDGTTGTEPDADAGTPHEDTSQDAQPPGGPERGPPDASLNTPSDPSAHADDTDG